MARYQANRRCVRTRRPHRPPGIPMRCLRVRRTTGARQPSRWTAAVEIELRHW